MKGDGGELGCDQLHIYKIKEIRCKERKVIWLWLSIHVLDERRRG